MDWKWGERKKNPGTIYMYVYFSHSQFENTQLFFSWFLIAGLPAIKWKLYHITDPLAWPVGWSQVPVTLWWGPQWVYMSVGDWGTGWCRGRHWGTEGSRDIPHSTDILLSQLYQGGCSGNAVEGPPWSHIAPGLGAHFWVLGTHWSSKVNNINPICNLHNFYVNQTYVYIAPWKSKSIMVIITIIISST